MMNLLKFFVTVATFSELFAALPNIPADEKIFAFAGGDNVMINNIGVWRCGDVFRNPSVAIQFRTGVHKSKTLYGRCIMRKKYETDLTDEQWAFIAPLFVNMRKRELINAVLYRRARFSGLWDSILQHLVKLTRQRAGLSKNPIQALIYSQSVKTTGAVEQKGFDMKKSRDSQSEFARYENGLLERLLSSITLGDLAKTTS